MAERSARRALAVTLLILTAGMAGLDIQSTRACGPPHASEEDWQALEASLTRLEEGDRAERLQAIAEGTWWPFAAVNDPDRVHRAAVRLAAYLARERDPWLVDRMAAQVRGRGREWMEPVAAVLSDHYAPSVRQSALDMGEHCSEPFVQRLQGRNAVESDPAIRREILTSLTSCASTAHLPQCAAGLFSADRDAVLAAFLCLEARKDPEDIEPLIRRAEKGEPYLRALALYSLQRRSAELDSEQRDELRERVEAMDPDSQTELFREHWLELAAELGSGAANRRLLEIVRTGDHGDATRAADLLARHQVAEAVGPILRRARRSPHPEAANFAGSLVRLGLEAESEELFRQWLDASNPVQVRRRVLHSLVWGVDGVARGAADRMLEWIVATETDARLLAQAMQTLIEPPEGETYEFEFVEPEVSHFWDFWLSMPDDPARYAVDPGRSLPSFRCHAAPGVEHSAGRSFRLESGREVLQDDHYDDGRRRWVSLEVDEPSSAPCWIPAEWIVRLPDDGEEEVETVQVDLELPAGLVADEAFLELERRRLVESFDHGESVVGARLAAGVGESVLAELIQGYSGEPVAPGPGSDTFATD